jgi:hypothetical protein
MDLQGHPKVLWSTLIVPTWGTLQYLRYRGVLQSTYSTLEGTHLLPIRLDAVRQRPALLQLNLHTHTRTHMHTHARCCPPARFAEPDFAALA